ncbi:ferredoxin [Streptomyces rapamycinicus NRRL 5491]|uniref:Ferredoxin n=2 Tax=Streptomyces rapamycinicus TaxID=1226757 RepID=A0A3L8RCH0_STRRN|nr:ferredoxin [Streptomyces rapamycinicus NRRL 5491]
MVSGMARWELWIDRTECIGSAVCVASAGAYFEMHGHQSRARASEIDADEHVIAVAQACPSGAIHVRVKETGELLEPQD